MSYERIINEIAKKIQEDKCVLFVGAGVSTIEGKQPSTDILKDEFIYDKLRDNTLTNEEFNELKKESFPEVVDKYFQKNFPEATEEIKADERTKISREFLDGAINLRATPNQAHLLLVDLNVKNIVTTNYDKLLEEAYKSIGFKEINKISISEQNEIDKHGLPNVFKLYGTAGDDKVIISKKQLDDIYNYSPVAAHVLGAFLTGKTVVFLGYSLLDSSVQNICERVRKSTCPPTSYCVLKNITNNSGEILKKFPFIRPIQCDALDFLYSLKMELIKLTLHDIETLLAMRKCSEVTALKTFDSHFKNDRDLKKALLRINDSFCDFEKVIEGVKAKRRSLEECWYQDYLFHESLYNYFESKHILKDFRENYLKIRCFYQSSQSEETRKQHSEINRMLQAGEYDSASTCMKKHLEHVAKESTFWNSYFIKLYKKISSPNNKEKFTYTLHQDFIFLKDKFGYKIKFSQTGKVLLLGNSGLGKTSFIKHEILQALANGGYIPIYVDFGETSNYKLITKSATISEFLESYFKSYNIKDNIFYKQKSFVEMKLDQGGFLFFFDGLDLIKENESYNIVITKINSFFENTNSRHCLISSQTQFYREMITHGKLSDFRQIEISDLDEKQVNEYLNKKGLPKHNVLLHVLKRYHNINFLILDFISELKPNNTNYIDNFSKLYEYYFRKIKKYNKNEIRELSEIGYLLNYKCEKLTTDLNEKAKRFSNIIELGENPRFSQHQSIGEFFAAIKLTHDLSIEQINNCISDSRKWPILIFLAGLLEDPNELIETLLKDNRTLLLAVRCIGNANTKNLNKESKNKFNNNVLRVIIKINVKYHIEGRIPTSEVAKELGALGDNGEETLKIFLEKNYEKDLENITDFTGFVKMIQINFPNDQSRPFGMLRRSAIASLGALKTDKAIKTLSNKLEEYNVYEEKGGMDIKEWQHNKWHICVALNKSICKEVSKIFEHLINNHSNLDRITKLEALFQLIRYYDPIIRYYDPREEKHKKYYSMLIEEIANLGKELLDNNFFWQRAHACEIIEKLSNYIILPKNWTTS